MRDLGALESLAAAARERFGGVDIVVANAGVGAYGDFLDLDVDVMNEIIDIERQGAAVHDSRHAPFAVRERLPRSWW